MENLCGYEGPENQRGGAPNLIALSPTQEFISTFFTSETPLKGMVLWQSVGTGKTCAAIATATKQFEPLGYTILWVTRTTLKNDIWKNMFDMVCHEGIKEGLLAGTINVPEDGPGRMRLLSKSWSVRPISYKQFSNLVSKNNQYYERLVKRNGEADPLKKTLIIIDEAHKLYGGGDLSSIERPDMAAFHQSLMNSYAVSGADSVRVLLMTATPITENPLELVKLINLCKPPDKQIPAEFDAFSDKYLDDLGEFTPIGRKLLLDDIAGHVSYLNREGDARQFARPILTEVAVPLVDPETAKDIRDFEVVGASDMDMRIAELKLAADEYKDQGFNKANAVKIARVCNEYPPEQRPDCEKLAKKYKPRFIKTMKNQASEWKDRMDDATQNLKMAKDAKMKLLRSARTARKGFPVEYENYQKSAYYKLRGCEKGWRELANIDEYLETQPGYSSALNLEDNVKEELNAVDDRINTDITLRNSRIKSYQNLLKTELAPLESQVVRRTIKSARLDLKKTKRRYAKWRSRLTRNANKLIKRVSQQKNAVKRHIKNTIREYMREEKRVLKHEKKRQQMEEDADEDLDAQFHEQLAKTQDELRVELEMRIAKNYQKAQAAVLKAQVRADKKAAKERVDADKKAAKERAINEKADKKAAKERVDADKKAAKERAINEKADKKAAKERVDADKKAAKERAITEKKAAKERAIKERAIKNTTRKNKQ